MGLASFIEAVITIEWSRPYCSNQQDGPAYAAFGLPLPYQVYGGVSSMEFDFMPHIYLFNVAVLSIVLLPLVRLALERFVPIGRDRWRDVIGGCALMLCIAFAATMLFSVGQGWLRPVISIGDDRYGSYFEFRPVGVAARAALVSCKASTFWFPDGWHGR